MHLTRGTLTGLGQRGKHSNHGSGMLMFQLNNPLLRGPPIDHFILAGATDTLQGVNHLRKTKRNANGQNRPRKHKQRFSATPLRARDPNHYKGQGSESSAYHSH
jgi:hypothetical protein